jgi:hypothetical protein
MENNLKPWEWIFVVENGNYVLKLADEKTRQKQLKEWKAKRKKELQEELRKLDYLK